MNEVWTAVIWALTPPVVVGLLWWFILRAIVRADRGERRFYAKIEAQERARRGLPHKS